MVATVDQMAESKPTTESVRLPKDLMRLARQISARRDVGAPEYLVSLLQPLIERDYADFLREVAGELEQSQQTPPKRKGKGDPSAN